jgi:hypothetical protein
MIRYLFLSVALSGCSHSAASDEHEVVAAGTKAVVEHDAAPALAAPVAKAGPTPAQVAAKAPPLPPSTCQALAKLPSDPPLALPGKNVVLTRFLKPCITPEGQRGYEKTTPYLAMGFPCSGGGGRIEIKGHYANPKMVTFLLGTDCPLAPSSRESVQQLLGSTFGLPVGVKLVAYTPFVVQYWEVPAMEDADIGYALELRSAPAVEGLWRRFLKHEPVRVHLFGRENTWVPGDSFYAVEADLTQSGRTTFQLQVVQVKALPKEQIAVVKQRCEALRPSRNCSEVF